jgi:hypothetical protein
MYNPGMIYNNQRIMYKILHFSGGVYKFDLLAEHVDDVGGLLIQESYLQKSRGSYFLSEEIQVIFIVPHNEVSSIELLASEIKGEIQEMEIEEHLKSNLINSMNIYNIICKAGDWITTDSIKESKVRESKVRESEEYNLEIDYRSEMEKSDLNKNSSSGIDNQQDSSIEDCLNLMLSLKLIEKKENDDDAVEFRILKDDK